MTPNEVYKLWAPDGSIWSNWVKPVSFADPVFGSGLYPPVNWQEANVSWAPAAESGTAIILDLEEAYAIWMGLALATRGFRPVPLYNGAPGISAIVDVGRIVGALHDTATELSRIPLPPNAPPVFLLDSRRSGGASYVAPGRFDNRWAVFPQDFPSANFLLANGIRAVVLGQLFAEQPQRDLAHVVLRWQEAGIRILTCDVRANLEPVPINVTKPGSFRSLWYRALVIVGLRRNSAGGFGAVVPEPSSSGGYG